LGLGSAACAFIYKALKINRRNRFAFQFPRPVKIGQGAQKPFGPGFGEIGEEGQGIFKIVRRI
jgi:hypothetical protein